MSDSEEENFSFYGKALDPYDEDLFPKKKPISVEDQIATDSHGRRRFHGAFTGGFSAGFFNTVGSLEGWKPSEFKSSRGDKQKYAVQNPEDFMDDEDKSEFGFAPEIVRATIYYDTTKKRKRKVLPEGPIPGEPVLHTLLTSGNETVGYLLLKNIGMKEKLQSKVDGASSQENDRVYGCEMPKSSEIPRTIEENDYKIPTLYEEFLIKRKDDTFGLGYTGLDKTHVNLFKSSNLVIREKDKKLSIKGQAFGVGAFENDDDDIYAKEDMSNYDFEMTKEKEKSTGRSKYAEELIFNSFCKAKQNSFMKEEYPPPSIPRSFTGKHKVKKSRFEPLAEVKKEEVERKNFDPIYRAQLLGEETNKSTTASKPISPFLHPKNEVSPQGSSKKTESSATKKPSFDVGMLLDDRFTSAKQNDETTNLLVPVEKYESDHFTKEMRDAAKLKMFGPLTRISENWQPCSLLCKRFNIPEPLFDPHNSTKIRKRTKNLIFEYQKFHEDNIALKPGISSQTSFLPEENQTVSNDDKDKDSVLVKEELKEEIDTELIIEVTNEESLEKKANSLEENDHHSEVVDSIDLTDKLNTQEKGDLFKAVFFSSSESEDEAEENDETIEIETSIDQIREKELKANVLGEELLLPKIKPVKEGILSGLNFMSFHKFEKPTTPKENKLVEGENGVEFEMESAIPENHVYGPRLPENKGKEKIESHIPVKVDTFCDTDSDEWIEKVNGIEPIREKRKKLKKKHKKKEKKHKHKRKKD